ncbi:MAG TPA: MBL fold metallo-hydrolase [Nitrolancea sp.]|nr:MBL fold metallo-hydrolase [Nitrolancea sp.]
MPTTSVEQLEPGVFIIDHRFQGVPGVIASYLLAGEHDLTMIETGATPTLETLLDGVRAAGFDPQDITQLAVTHIHLDHAGSAGVLMRRLPRARLLVHPFGAPHMIDPTKLMASATRIYGERMEELWGEVAPVPAERVDILEDGARFRAGGRELVALHTPGHAMHHIAYHDPETNGVFTGDVAGVRLEKAAYVRPPTVPPELDLILWRESIERLRALNPRRFYLTHFGEFDNVSWHLDDLLSRLLYWSGWTDAHLENESDTVVVTEALRELGDAEIVAACGDEHLVRPYEVATSYQMTVDGIARYLRKRRSQPQPARLY